MVPATSRPQPVGRKSGRDPGVRGYGAALHSPVDVPGLPRDALALAADQGLPAPVSAYFCPADPRSLQRRRGGHREDLAPGRRRGRQSGNLYSVLMIDCVRAIFTTPLTPELVAHYEQLIAQLEELGRPSLMAVACLAYGSIRFASGDVERGLQLTDSALTHAERAGYLIDTGIQAECAPIYLLADKTDAAAAMLQRNLPVNRDSDQTILTAQDVALVALIAANDDHLVAAATLT